MKKIIEELLKEKERLEKKVIELEKGDQPKYLASPTRVKNNIIRQINLIDFEIKELEKNENQKVKSISII